MLSCYRVHERVTMVSSKSCETAAYIGTGNSPPPPHRHYLERNWTWSLPVADPAAPSRHTAAERCAPRAGSSSTSPWRRSDILNIRGMFTMLPWLELLVKSKLKKKIMLWWLTASRGCRWCRTPCRNIGTPGKKSHFVDKNTIFYDELFPPPPWTHSAAWGGQPPSRSLSKEKGELTGATL